MKLDKCNLLLGSSGSIGVNLKKYFERTEQIVYTVSRDANNSLSEVSQHFSGDLSDKNFVEKFSISLLNKFNYIDIFYLAGTSSVDASLNDIGGQFSSSINSYCNILEAFKLQSVKIIFASSGSVYGEKKLNYFNENDKLSPVSPYAAIKIACENLSTIYSNLHSMDIRIARIFSIYGGSIRKLFVYDCIKKLMNNQNEIILKGSGTQIRDYLHIDDVINGLIIIKDKGQFSSTYNLCSGKPKIIGDIANKIKASLKINKKIIWNKIDSESERNQWYGNNAKLKNLGFKEDTSFDIMLDNTVKNIYKELSEQ